jgi:hypothetical protein
MTVSRQGLKLDTGSSLRLGCCYRVDAVGGRVLAMWSSVGTCVV